MAQTSRRVDDTSDATPNPFDTAASPTEPVKPRTRPRIRSKAQAQPTTTSNSAHAANDAHQINHAQEIIRADGQIDAYGRDRRSALRCFCMTQEFGKGKARVVRARS
jgi:hypothetical protein